MKHGLFISAIQMGCGVSNVLNSTLDGLIVHNFYTYQGKIMQILAIDHNQMTCTLGHPFRPNDEFITLDTFDELVPYINNTTIDLWSVGQQCTLRWFTNVYTGTIVDITAAHAYIKYTDGLNISTIWLPLGCGCLFTHHSSHYHVVVNAPDEQTCLINSVEVVLHGWYWYGFRPIQVVAISGDVFKITYMDTDDEYQYLIRHRIVHRLEEYQPLASDRCNVSAGVARVRGVRCGALVRGKWLVACVGHVTPHVFQLICNEHADIWLPLNTDRVAPLESQLSSDPVTRIALMCV